MEMKDKLVKTHRTGYYFKAKKIALTCSCALGLIAIVSIPTYITLSTHENQSISEASNNDVNQEQIDIQQFSDLQ